MNIDTFIPYCVGIDVLAFLLIPVNLGLEDSSQAERAKNLVLLAYMGALAMMCVMGMAKSDGLEHFAFIVMELCAAATLPLTIWRIASSPRNRRRG